MLFAACVLGVLNKQGVPKFNLDYLRQVIPDEHFQNLGYLGVVIFLGGVNFVVYSPLVLFAFLTVSDVVVKTPSIKLPAMIMTYFRKGVNERANYLSLRADLEIYIGVYLIVGWFLGWSTIISIFFYWQYIRLKYMLNYNTQLGFQKIGSSIDGYVSSPNTPAILKTVWGKVKWFCNYMVKTEQPGQGGASPSMCTIF